MANIFSGAIAVPSQSLTLQFRCAATEKVVKEEPEIAVDAGLAEDEDVQVPTAKKVSERVVVFENWRCHSQGATVECRGKEEEMCVHMCWHSDTPASLPTRAEDALCDLRLFKRNQANNPEIYEAKLLPIHLQQPLQAWTESRLRRLMVAMGWKGHECRTAGNAKDSVLLRHQHGRLTIDVMFGHNSGPHAVEKVVDVLNAYPTLTSPRCCRSELLRSAGEATLKYRTKIRQMDQSRNTLRSAMSKLETAWKNACEIANKTALSNLRRFATLLQAKVDKEKSLATEAHELRRAVCSLAASTGQNLLGGPLQPIDPAHGGSIPARGRGTAAKRKRPNPDVEAFAPVTRGMTKSESMKGVALSDNFAGQQQTVRKDETRRRIDARSNQTNMQPNAVCTLSLFDPGSSGDEAPPDATPARQLQKTTTSTFCTPGPAPPGQTGPAGAGSGQPMSANVSVAASGPVPSASKTLFEVSRSLENPVLKMGAQQVTRDASLVVKPTAWAGAGTMAQGPTKASAGTMAGAGTMASDVPRWMALHNSLFDSDDD